MRPGRTCRGVVTALYRHDAGTSCVDSTDQRAGSTAPIRSPPPVSVSCDPPSSRNRDRRRPEEPTTSFDHGSRGNVANSPSRIRHRNLAMTPDGSLHAPTAPTARRDQRRMGSFRCRHRPRQLVVAINVGWDRSRRHQRRMGSSRRMHRPRQLLADINVGWDHAPTSTSVGITRRHQRRTGTSPP